jgi:hypothetical protein
MCNYKTKLSNSPEEGLYAISMTYTEEEARE